ncbi:hypothetical protein, partial [Thalassospira mesophila]|uniref:hypothetical protein n=1 Tax=Thalassospira mesophila TaxID=1293891 RepID=UPI001B80BBC6
MSSRHSVCLPYKHKYAISQACKKTAIRAFWGRNAGKLRNGTTKTKGGDGYERKNLGQIPDRA